MQRVGVLLLTVLLLAGCSLIPSGGTPTPPALSVTAGNQIIPVKLGSYCWKSGSKAVCADGPGPRESFRGEAPPVVTGARELQLKFATRTRHLRLSCDRPVARPRRRLLFISDFCPIRVSDGSNKRWMQSSNIKYAVLNHKDYKKHGRQHKRTGDRRFFIMEVSPGALLRHGCHYSKVSSVQTLICHGE